MLSSELQSAVPVRPDPKLPADIVRNQIITHIQDLLIAQIVSTSLSLVCLIVVQRRDENVLAKRSCKGKAKNGTDDMAGYCGDPCIIVAQKTCCGLV